MARTRPKGAIFCRLAGAVAQLGERLVRNEEVRGSTPLGSTKSPVSYCKLNGILDQRVSILLWDTSMVHKQRIKPVSEQHLLRRKDFGEGFRSSSGIDIV